MTSTPLRLFTRIPYLGNNHRRRRQKDYKQIVCTPCRALRCQHIFPYDFLTFNSRTAEMTILFSHAAALVAMTVLSTYSIHGVESYTNVYGNQLQSCSSSGMALTGYTRSGYCTDENDDTGSHHICIDLSSTRTEHNFCYVTGQDDWCSDYMTCHDDNGNDNDDDENNNICPVENWCVCQWAFATYIQNAGGCDYVQDIVCDAINEEAIIAYKQKINTEKFQEALECIADRCGISIEGIQTSRASFTTSRKTAALWGLILGIAAAVTGAFFYTSRRQTIRMGQGAYIAANDKHIAKGTIE